MKRARMDPVGPFGRTPLEPHQLVERRTRAEDVIVLCHLGVAHVRREDWSLSIDGLVRRPMRLSFADLERRPRTELASIHQCCGNPLKPDEPTRRITNVVWTGTRLSDLLAECQPEPSARFVWSAGADHGSIAGEEVEAFVKDMPLERAADDVLIAWELNGEPLRPENGFPARLVVPGFYGTNSVKWLTGITLAAERAPGPFTTRWYNDPVRDAAGRPTGATTPVWSIAPESVIVSPAPDQTLPSGPAELWGWAWADGGVDSVEISTDGGATWNRAALEPPSGRTWQRFTAPWRPQPGAHDLCSRARTADGRAQPADGARNAVHHVRVDVAS